MTEEGCGVVVARQSENPARGDEPEHDLRKFRSAKHRTEQAPFEGKAHADVLQMKFEGERMLINDLIPTASVGAIAAIPEVGKSWLAQEIAVTVAGGVSRPLGFRCVQRGPVGYFWQDDSTREEGERIQLYERLHPSEGGLDLTWYLNEGLQLPRDIERLRATVEEKGFVLVVIDSLYNTLLGHDLKAEVPEQVMALLKAEIADKLGCTVLVVDHQTWSNEGRNRAYGGVFKAAATRFGIYLRPTSKARVEVEVRGNNFPSFKKKAYFDPTTLRFKVETKDDETATRRRTQMRKEIEAVLRKHKTAHSGNQIVQLVTGKTGEIRDVLEEMRADPTCPVQAQAGARGAVLWSLKEKA